jgi:hypothetical protein
MMESRMTWVGHIKRMGELRKLYRILIEKPERKILLLRPRLRLEG